jgi:putative ABC transport system permease protein
VSITESFRVAIGALLSNKLRSFLTMLGIIIGVAAVIALISLGQGSQAAVEARMTALGTNLITVNAPRQARLTDKDVTSIFNRVDGLAYQSPTVNQQVTAKARNATYDTTMTGVGSQYPAIRDYTVQSGRFFDDEDVTQRRRVAVIGATVFKELFSSRGAVGETVNLRGQTFTVIGICASKGSSGGMDSDDVIFIPYSVAQRLAGSRYITNIVFKAESADVATMSADHITRILEEKVRTTSRLSSQQRSNPFRVFSQDELLSTMSEVSNTFTAMLAGIASISLLVGGIGIMNIMLVSVTERTREIGIRKALGAKRSAILMQFLVEATVISGIGGVLGVFTGVGTAQTLANFSNTQALVSPTATIVAFAFSAAIGIFFGLYPASRAAKLDPIVALRYE